MKKIAVLGPKGTYSDIAFQEFFKDKEKFTPIFYPSIMKTYLGLDECNYAVLPFENTLDGFVIETLDLISSNNYKILGQIALNIDFAFVSNSNDISKVKTVYSQFKAAGQCLEFIKKNYFTISQTESNIDSLNKVMDANDTFGAIVPEHSIKNINFNIVIHHVADSISNQTRFFILGKEEIKNDYKELECSMIIKPLEDKVGMLYEILGTFQKENINLKAIMSRPNKKMMGKYIFYFEFCLNKNEIDNVYKLKKDLENTYKVSILGIYNKL